MDSINEERKYNTSNNYIDYVSKWVEIDGELCPGAPDERIVKKLEKVEKGGHPFNIFCFLLGAIYLVYRKCYGIAAAVFGAGIIIFTVEEICLAQAGEWTYNIVDAVVLIVFSLILGFLFYPLYRKDLIRRVKKGRNLKKWGGTNIAAPLIIAAAVVMLYVVAMVYIMFCFMYPGQFF